MLVLLTYIVTVILSLSYFDKYYRYISNPSKKIKWIISLIPIINIYAIIQNIIWIDNIENENKIKDKA